MANGNGNGNGKNGNQWIMRWALGGGGVLTVVLAFSVNVAKDARIAIDVARQHGEEMLLLNAQIQALAQDVRDRTQLRYTSKDAERDLDYIKRDLQICADWRADHERLHARD